MKQWFALILGILGLALLSFGQDSFQIGALGEEGELIFPRQFAEGPDGSIYVYDQSDAFIKVFSAKGRYLRKLGGEGQGPGEIQRSDGVSFGFTPARSCISRSFLTGIPGSRSWTCRGSSSGSSSSIRKSGSE